jgi:hypothetical protein
MRRTEKYAAVTRDEGNAADGRFPTTSLVFRILCPVRDLRRKFLRFFLPTKV